MDSVRFMATSLSSVADNLDERHNNKCKDCKSSLEYIRVDDKL